MENIKSLRGLKTEEKSKQNYSSTKPKIQWYDPGKLLSYDAIVYMVTGGRGIGKTFNVLKKVLYDCEKNDKKFVYLRRTDKELMRVKNKIFNGLITADVIPPNKYYVVGDTFYRNEENGSDICGYAMALNIIEQYKSTAYDDVQYIIFEEFINEQNRYLKREIELFFMGLETIIRLRNNVKVIMLANMMTKYNPYFTQFKVVPKAGERFTYNKVRGVVLEQATAPDVVDEKQKSKFGRLIAGTDYGEFIVNNKAIKDNEDFIIDLRKKGKDPYYNFFLEDKEYCFYRFEKNNNLFYYVEAGFNKSVNNFFNLDDKLREFSTNKVRGSSKFLQFIYDRARDGKMYFDSGETKAVIQELLYNIR